MITLAAIVPDFDNGVGTAVIFPASTQFGTTTGKYNDLTNKYVFGAVAMVWLINFIIISR